MQSAIPIEIQNNNTETKIETVESKQSAFALSIEFHLFKHRTFRINLPSTTENTHTNRMA